MVPTDLIGIAASITALGVIAGIVRWAYLFARRVERAIGEDARGRSISERLTAVEDQVAPAGEPTMREQLTTMSSRVARVEHQVFPNGGKSLSDQVRNVDKAVGEVKATTEVIKDMVTALVDGRANNQK